MTPSLKSLAATAVVAALAGGLACWGTATWMRHDRAEPSLHDVVHDRLDLTPEQRQRIEALEVAFASERNGLEGELREANRELVESIAANQGDTPEVQAAVDHFHVAMGDLQKATLGHVFEMRAVLDPAQAETFDAAIVETLRSRGD